MAIGVSGQSSFARFIKLPPVEPKKIPEIVRFEAIQQIPFPLDDVEWSYQLFQSAESPDVEVGIFAMRKELVNQHIQYFTDVDLNVQVVQMNPLAVYNAMQRDERFSETTMVIDMGAENTDLIIADDETVWLRSIPIGGNNFTEALVKSFKLNFAKAEELKRNAATSKYARQIFQAMRPVFADLVAEIQRSIGFYASVHRDSRIRKIIALGGTFRLPGLQKYLQQNLQLDVERLNGLSAGAPSDSKLATTFNENLLSLVGAYGLALQAMGEGKITSSLLPQHIRRAKLWKEKTKWFASAAAMFVAGTAIPYGSLYMHSSALEQAMRTHEGTINNTKSQAEQLSNEWTEVEQSGGNDRQRIINIRSLLDERNLWPMLIKDIHDALPQDTTAAADVAKLKQTPRDQRNIILIDSIRSAYHVDLNPFLVTGKFSEAVAADTPLQVASFEGGADVRDRRRRRGGAGDAPDDGRWSTDGRRLRAADNGRHGRTPDYGDGGNSRGRRRPSGPPQRGFLITVRCTTPNRAGYALVDKTLVNNLLKLAPGRMASGRTRSSRPRLFWPRRSNRTRSGWRSCGQRMRRGAHAGRGGRRHGWRNGRRSSDDGRRASHDGWWTSDDGCAGRRSSVGATSGRLHMGGGPANPDAEGGRKSPIRFSTR